MSEPRTSIGASSRLRILADEYDANALTYGREMALDILVSDLTEALDDLAAEASHV